MGEGGDAVIGGDDVFEVWEDDFRCGGEWSVGELCVGTHAVVF